MFKRIEPLPVPVFTVTVYVDPEEGLREAMEAPLTPDVVNEKLPVPNPVIDAPKVTVNVIELAFE
jgi:hypothetical protein